MADPLVWAGKMPGNQRCPADIPKKPVIVRSFALSFPIAVPVPFSGPEGTDDRNGLMRGMNRAKFLHPIEPQRALIFKD
jgi:hypothetical protein